MPWVSKNFRKTLYAGTAPYTYHYEKLFHEVPSSYATIDINPSVAVWGAKEHFVGPIQDIPKFQTA